MRRAIYFLCLWACSLLAGHAQEADEANYDESKIPPYTLPALLKTANGREVTTVQQWEQTRRPELLSIFTEQVYGKMPADKVDVSYKKLDDNHSAVNGSATRKQIEITFSHNGVERKALLLMYLPNHVKTKAPVFLHFNFQGNQTISSDPDIIPSQHSDRPRGNQASRWPVEKIIDAGYGLATVHYFDFFPDSKDRYAESILALFGYQSEGDIPADGGQAIAAWAWGYSRVMDYLETDSPAWAKPPFGLARPIRVLQSSSPTNPDVAEQPCPDGKWAKRSTGSTTFSHTGSARTSASITRKRTNCRSTSTNSWPLSLPAPFMWQAPKKTAGPTRKVNFFQPHTPERSTSSTE